MFNRKENRIDDILDECLERILINGDSVEDCLASYRQYTDELEPLLKTSLVAIKAADIEPRPDFKARARYQFNSALKEAATKKHRRFFGWQLRWATMASLVLTLLLSGGGIVAAASNSMPDNPLYQVKLATEQIQLFLTTSPEAKAELHAKLADRRVDEIIYMAEEDNADMIEATTKRLQVHLSVIADIYDELSVRVLYEDWQDVQTTTEMVTRTVTTTIAAGGILSDSTVKTMPAPTPDDIITTTVGEEDVLPATEIPSLTIPSPAVSNGKGFANRLNTQSASNIAALNSAIETASEEVKTALAEAIALLEGGILEDSTSGVTSTVTETVTTTLE